MADFTVSRAGKGYQIEVDGLVLTVESPHYDRGSIRAALTIRDDDGILYRDTVNLTSERARAKVLRKLTEQHDIDLDERAVVALDEACRTGRTDDEKNVRDGGTDFSETVPHTLDELTAAFGTHLLITDTDYLPIFAGAILAHRTGGEPAWLLIVAPPGGTKTEPIRSLYGSPGIYPLSDLSARTFASGLDPHGGDDPSLLARLSTEIIVLKDLTTVLQKSHDDRQEIFAQLREIYDGRFDRAWGTGRELHWEGRLGFVAGVTPVIDEHQAAMAVLGERFILFRLKTPDRKKVARRALDGAGSEREMRDALRGAMHGFLASRAGIAPTVDTETLDQLAAAADFVTRARSGVLRDGYRRELNYAPEAEVPTRFAKVLLSLARGIALAADHDHVGAYELRLVMRVALDCLPLVRHRVVSALVEHHIMADDDGHPTTSTIAGTAQFATVTIRRALEDLQALGIVTVHKAGKGKADSWEIKPEWADIFKVMRDGGSDKSEKASEGLSVSENSPPPAQTTCRDESAGEWRHSMTCSECGCPLQTEFERSTFICTACLTAMVPADGGVR